MAVLSPWTLRCLAILFVLPNVCGQALPVVTVMDTDYTATEGTHLTLHCSAKAIPAVTSNTWYKDGVVLDMSSDKFSGGTLGQPSLTIKSVNKSDAGSYICQATNDLGSTDSSTIRLVVRSLPVVTVMDTDYTATEGTLLTLHCSAKATPTVTTYTWYKDGAVLDMSDDQFSGGTLDQPSLIIKSVDKTDAGSYICQATNDLGSTNSSTIRVVVRSLPVVTVMATDYTATEGTHLTLHCSAKATPEVISYIWYKDGGTVDMRNDRFSGGTLSQPSLTIKSVYKTDAGSYICQATNVLGSTSSPTIRVVVRY